MDISTPSEALVTIETLATRLRREGGTLSDSQRLRFLACRDQVDEIIESIDSASASKPSAKAMLKQVPERLRHFERSLPSGESDVAARKPATTLRQPILASRPLPVLRKRPKLSPIIACWCGSRSNHD
jgi:hypothetical protein